MLDVVERQNLSCDRATSSIERVRNPKQGVESLVLRVDRRCENLSVVKVDPEGERLVPVQLVRVNDAQGTTVGSKLLTKRCGAGDPASRHELEYGCQGLVVERASAGGSRRPAAAGSPQRAEDSPVARSLRFFVHARQTSESSRRFPVASRLRILRSCSMLWHTAARAEVDTRFRRSIHAET